MGVTISGYAALFYDGTRGTEFELFAGVFERIAPTAFDNALAHNFDYDTVAAVNHDPNLPLGRRGDGKSTLLLSKDSRGLKYEVDAPDTTIARDAIKNIRARIIKGSSFMFALNDEQWSKDGAADIRTVLDVALLDVAPVVYPAYKGTELPDFAVTVSERSIADDARTAKRFQYAQRAADIAREQHSREERTMVLSTGQLSGRVLECANVRRDGHREAIFGQAKRLIVTRFDKLQAESRTADPKRRAEIVNELRTLAQRKAGLDSVLEGK